VTTDPLVAAARFLLAQLEWTRHATDEQGQPYAVTAYAEVAHCAGRMRSLLDGPPPKRYLGPCGALVLTPEPWEPGTPASTECDGDIYAPRNGTTGRCRTCGATVPAEDRQQWLNEEVRAHAFRAAALAEAYRINVNTIRSWALRGHLRSYWRTAGGLVIPWTDPVLDPKLKGEEMERRLGEISDEIQARGGRLHYVGDVLDLAAEAAARRETERAKRERRKDTAA
jgi:hypothetical protein